MELTETQLDEIIVEAQKAAEVAAEKFFQEQLGGVDRYGCGFAWVNIFKYNGKNIRGNSRLSRWLGKHRISQDYRRIHNWWNPSKHGAQNVDTLEAGAQAAAKVLESYGFTAYAGSRLD